MGKVGEIPFEALFELPRESTELWVDPAVRTKVANTLKHRIGEPAEVAPETKTVVAVGGGTLLDIAKAWRADTNPETQLIAVPSVWGSGAEVSPVVVLNVEGQKAIRVDDRFLPDKVVYWPELAESLPESAVRDGCGDCWAHALEGFLSPLADDGLRDEASDLMRRMLTLGVAKDPAWFRLSSAACSVQARSSVGLVHGIAHTLEGPLRAEFPDAGWGHAKLCAAYLLPVMAFNGQGEGKSSQLLEKYGVSLDDVMKIAEELHDFEVFFQALPFLTAKWKSILRDQCSRTNVRLVRPSDLEFFQRWAVS